MKRLLLAIFVIALVSGLIYGCSSPGAPSMSLAGPSTPIISSSSGRVKIDVIGYISHEPLQETVQAIKDTLEKYGDKIDVSWVDADTTQGSIYAALHHMSAHMNIVINGKYEYQVNGKDVVFTYFEGGTWTMTDLDAIIASLVNK